MPPDHLSHRPLPCDCAGGRVVCGATAGQTDDGRTDCNAARTNSCRPDGPSSPPVVAHSVPAACRCAGLTSFPRTSVPVSFQVLTSGWCPGSHYEPTSPVVYLHLGVVSSFLSTSVPQYPLPKPYWLPKVLSDAHWCNAPPPLSTRMWVWLPASSVLCQIG